MSIGSFIEKIRQRLLRTGRKKIVAILVAAFLCAGAMTAYSELSASHLRLMTLTLNYEGAKKGLNPAGSRFNISDIKSDSVLKRALEILDDDTLSVVGIKSRINIDAKMPRSAVDRTTEAIAAGSTYSYSPSEFDIYYSQKKKFGKNRTVDFLRALSEAYTEHFNDTYSEKNTILEFTPTDYSQYDYQEIHQILQDKVNSMISYLGTHKTESNAFRSQNTGYTFGNLTAMLINLRDIDLARFEAYILQNGISKDRAVFIRKQQYRIDKGMLRYNMAWQASDIMNAALEEYDAQITGVAFIPSVDNSDQFYMSRTKTGLDNLVNNSYSEGIRATGLKKDIDKQNDLIAKYSVATETTADAAASADKMISDICEFIDRISAISIQTDNDYLSSKTNNYITFNLPSSARSIPVVPFIKNCVISLILVLAAVKLFGLARLAVLAPKKEDEEV